MFHRKVYFEVYYDLLWNAAYQHDLNNAAEQKQRKALVSIQNDPFDKNEYDPGEDTPLIQMRMIIPYL